MRGGRRYLKTSDVQFLSDTIDAIWTRVERSRWRSEAEREKFHAAITQAKAFYQRLLLEAARGGV